MAFRQRIIVFLYNCVFISLALSSASPSDVCRNGSPIIGILGQQSENQVYRTPRDTYCPAVITRMRTQLSRDQPRCTFLRSFSDLSVEPRAASSSNANPLSSHEYLANLVSSLGINHQHTSTRFAWIP